MAISDLTAGQGKVNLTAKITDVSEPREFQKFGNSGKVANATLEDDSGKMTLTLWNEQGDLVKEGMKVHIINGWCSEYQGEKQLSTGKFGRLEVVENKE